MNKKTFLKLGALIFITSLMLTGCGQSEPAADELITETAMVVATEIVIEEAIEEIVELSGVVTSQKQVNIIPKVPGKVAAAPYQVGQTVKSGDVLFRLDAEELTVQLQQAEAGLAVAQANLAMQQKGAREEELIKAKAHYENMKKNYERMKSLYEAGAIPLSQLEEVELGLINAETSWQMAEAGATPEALAVTEAQVKQAEAAVEIVRVNLNNTVIKSPITGVIAALNAEVGELVGQTAPVATIVNMDNVEVEFNVAESLINKIKTGDQVQVKVAAVSNEPFTGKVKSISPVVNQQTKQFTVKITLDNKNGLLKPGMFAQVYLVTDQAENALQIPKEAIITANGNPYVFVMKEGRAVKRPVTLGLENVKLIQVVEGLTAGEEIIVKGQHLLEDGYLVTGENGGEQ